MLKPFKVLFGIAFFSNRWLLLKASIIEEDNPETRKLKAWRYEINSLQIEKNAIPNMFKYIAELIGKS